MILSLSYLKLKFLIKISTKMLLKNLRLKLFLFLSLFYNIYAQNTLIVSPVYTTKGTCLDESKSYGQITSNVNKQIAEGTFTMYGIGGRGACGLDIDTVIYYLLLDFRIELFRA